MILIIDKGRVNQLDLEIKQVYGGNLHGEFRTIVCGKTKIEICQTLGITIYELKTWWSETGNAKEVLMANLFPGKIIVWTGHDWEVYPCVPHPKFLKGES